jgi:raffinose/stachyose/melibiose transport system permease protein
MQRSTKPKKTAGQVIMMAVLIAFAAVQLFPLVWLIDMSLSSNTEFTRNILVIPKTIRFDNYVNGFTNGHVGRYLLHSLVVNTLAVVLVLVISIMASFACTRMKWKLAGLVRTILLLGMMIPIYATFLPNYIIYDRFKILDTLWALLIPYVAFSLPQGEFITSGFIEGVPKELEEAAVVDGCGIFRMLASIIVPVLTPAMVTVAIMTFLNNWNEFMMAQILLRSPAWKTLPFSVLEFVGEHSVNYVVQFAVMAMSALPAVIVYLLLNKQITKGVMLGAVKG